MRQRGLSRIEDLVQEMVEGTFGRLFGGRLEPLDVANHLIRAIEDYEQSGQMALRYRIELNPDDFQFLTGDNPQLAGDLADAAQQLGRHIGVDGSSKPTIQLEADSKLRRRRLRISVEQIESDQGPRQITQTFRHSKHHEDYLTAIQQLDAFLIVQGRRHIPLEQPLISIGRRIDNDVILDLPSVSRQHAQIRWRFGNFVLYDISSKNNTSVNGHPAHERVLRPGDVIALGEALLIYGAGNEDNARMRSKDSEDDETKARSRRML